MVTEKRKKNPSKKRMKWLLILLSFFTIWASITVYKQWKDINAVSTQISELEKNEQKALDTKKDLQKKVELLQDEDYIADLARKYYFLSKPGEIIFISPKE